jgi:hypothetical protein
MMSRSFEEIWKQIVARAGETFHTKTGLEFTYRVDSDEVYPNRTNYRIPKTDFKTAFKLVPIDGQGKIYRSVRGPAYVWTILHDPKISRGEW